MALNQHLKAEHEGCIVRAKQRAMGQEGMKTAGWDHVLEAQQVNDATIISLTDQQGNSVNELQEVFQGHLAQLSERGGEMEHWKDLADLLTHLPRLSKREAECCEGPISAAVIEEVPMDCCPDKSPELDGLPYKLYSSVSDLFQHLLACVFTNWQQNGFISKSVNRGECWYLFRRDPNKGCFINIFRPIALLNAEPRFWPKY